MKNSYCANYERLFYLVTPLSDSVVCLNLGNYPTKTDAYKAFAKLFGDTFKKRNVYFKLPTRNFKNVQAFYKDGSSVLLSKKEQIEILKSSNAKCLLF